MSILITVLALGVMILIHEAGHFFAAKKFGVLVHEFAIGMGPKIFSFGKKETKYSLRLFPIGGYVRLEGELEEDDDSNPRSFINLSPIKRIVVLAAGATMNILLGFILFIIINLNTGVAPSIVSEIPKEYENTQTVFEVGDRIVKLNNTVIHTFDDVSLFMSRCDDNTISVTIERDGVKKEIIDFKPYSTSQGKKLGVIFKYEDASFFKSAQYAFYDTVYITKAVVIALGDLISGKVGMNSLSGPVEIANVVNQVASAQSDYAFISLLLLFATITVNLGVFNLLPFPALDGGSLVFALYELITRKKVKKDIMNYASMIGFALLMILAVAVTADDIIALF